MTDKTSMKKQIRKEMKDKRLELSPERISEYSEQIYERLRELKPIREAEVIMGFASIKNEVELMPYMDKLRAEGKTILLPRVEEDGNMVAVEYLGIDKMKLSSMGILEPEGQAYAVEKIEAVLVPGLVFDANGYRMGYGAGFYDRFIPLMKENAFRCGVCYEFQVIDDTYPHEKDVPVHWIVTNKSEVGIDFDFF